mgnify:CR=1 FL=1
MNADPKNLTPVQARVLACLMEKKESTPDQYPLTLNALRNACNQKSSRSPVVDYSEGEVGHALRELEAMDRHYLFKLKRSQRVKQLIAQVHGQGRWTRFNEEWELKESTLELQGWKRARRVVVARRRLAKDPLIGLEYQRGGQRELALVEGPEDMRLFEYSVLVTNLDDELVTLMGHYRDRADCENNFDELKNHWGWGGFTTQDLKRCRFMARITGLIYNWWSLFVRLADPTQHTEAITSRPLLLHAPARLTRHGGQTRITISHPHAEIDWVQEACRGIAEFFKTLRQTAEQLTPVQRWYRVLSRALIKYLNGRQLRPPALLPAPG